MRPPMSYIEKDIFFTNEKEIQRVFFNYDLSVLSQILKISNKNAHQSRFF